MCTVSSVDLSTSALFQASFEQLVQDVFLLDSFATSPSPSPGVFHSMVFENNPGVENCSISATPKALDFSTNTDTSNAATEQVVPSANSSSINNSTHKVKVHRLSRELSSNISGSDLDVTAKISAIANAVKGLIN